MGGGVVEIVFTLGVGLSPSILGVGSFLFLFCFWGGGLVWVVPSVCKEAPRAMRVVS